MKLESHPTGRHFFHISFRNIQIPRRPQYYNSSPNEWEPYYDSLRPRYRSQESFQYIYPPVLPQYAGMPRMSRYAELHSTYPRHITYPTPGYAQPHAGTERIATEFSFCMRRSLIKKNFNGHCKNLFFIGPLTVRTFHGAGAYHPNYGNTYRVSV